MNPARTAPAPPSVFACSNRSTPLHPGLSAGMTMSVLPRAQAMMPAMGRMTHAEDDFRHDALTP